MNKMSTNIVSSLLDVLAEAGAAVVAITGQVSRAERGSDFHKEMQPDWVHSFSITLYSADR
jgi:hypothetical protein